MKKCRTSKSKANTGRRSVRSAPPPWLGAPRSGVDKSKIRAVNARMAKATGQVGLNPYRFSKITISENDYYTLAGFALRYAMGGGTIGTSAVIGEVISAAGFSELGKRIGTVICRDYEDYVRLHRDGDESKVDTVWRRSYRWLKALRDDSFMLVHARGKDESGKDIAEDVVAFDVDGLWFDAKFFVTNQIAARYVAPKYVSSIEPFHWKDLLVEGI